MSRGDETAAGLSQWLFPGMTSAHTSWSFEVGGARQSLGTENFTGSQIVSVLTWVSFNDLSMLSGCVSPALMSYGTVSKTHP